MEKLLEDGESLADVVIMWSRHRWFVPYAAMAGIIVFVLTSALEVEGTVNRLALAGCAVAVASMSTTNYWVLAKTTNGFALCRSSRIRQRATSLVRRLDPGAEMRMVGSTVITSDWRIEGDEYTMSKRWEATMRALAAGQDTT